MSKVRYAGFLLLTIMTISFFGCETDIDVIAPKRDVTVVYGLLELNRTRHYIRINKAFVGEESANTLAAKQGINEYADDELLAVIQEVDANGNEINAWELQPTYTYSKEEGPFFSDSNKVYYFDATLNSNNTYRLTCTVDIEGEDSKLVMAETKVIGSLTDPIRLDKPKWVGASNNSEVGDRAEVDFIGSGDYANSLDIKWTGAAGGVLYSSYYRFYYTEIDSIAGTRKRDSLTFNIGTKRLENSSGGTVIFNINPEEFFSRIDRDIDDYDFESATFSRIASDTLQFFLEIADQTLATYIQVNEPITEVVQEQPEYTNVVNGIGIFASRYITSTRDSDTKRSGRIFESITLEELLYSKSVDGEESYNTINKGFKVPFRCNDDIPECR